MPGGRFKRLVTQTFHFLNRYELLNSFEISRITSGIIRAYMNNYYTANVKSLTLFTGGYSWSPGAVCSTGDSTRPREGVPIYAGDAYIRVESSALVTYFTIRYGQWLTFDHYKKNNIRLFVTFILNKIIVKKNIRIRLDYWR